MHISNYLRHTRGAGHAKLIDSLILAAALVFLCTFPIAANGDDAPAAPSNDDANVYHDYIAGRPFQAGYRRIHLDVASPTGETVSRPLDLWYPTDEREADFLYLYQRGRVAVDAEVLEGQHPLLVFSHGFMSASDQSIYIMEACARAGYIVAAMNHHDALLNRRDGRVAPPRATDLEDWTESHYADRRQDIVRLLDELLSWNTTEGHEWQGRIDPEAIGAIGHSLGGYTLLGMAGAWPTWREPRIQAIVLYSPYVHPFRENGDLAGVSIPVMMQGGTFDLGISPFLLPIYRELQCPKHYLILEGAAHLVWTNFISLASTTVECLEEENPRLAVDYTIAFFDHFLLKQDQSELLTTDDPRLHDWAADLDREGEAPAEPERE